MSLVLGMTTFFSRANSIHIFSSPCPKVTLPVSFHKCFELSVFIPQIYLIQPSRALFTKINVSMIDDNGFFTDLIFCIFKTRSYADGTGLCS